MSPFFLVSFLQEVKLDKVRNTLSTNKKIALIDLKFILLVELIVKICVKNIEI